MPTESSPGSAEVALLLDLPADIRVAIGRPATGLDGFRRTHVDALTTQRMLSRLVSSWPVARYDDIQLVALMTTDPNRGGEFVADILGHFVGADEDLTKRFQEVLKYGRGSGVQLGDYDIPQYARSLWRQRDPHQQHRRVRERIQTIPERSRNHHHRRTRRLHPQHRPLRAAACSGLVCLSEWHVDARPAASVELRPHG
jgi:hypothetical protein